MSDSINNYLCRTTDNSGKVQEIQIQAQNITDIQNQLAEKGLFLIKHQIITESASKVSLKIIIAVTEQLSILLQSGTQLTVAIEMCIRLSQKDEEKSFLNTIYKGLTKGKSFAKSLEPYKNELPGIYLGMIRIGERIGKLNQVLTQLSDFLKRQQKLKEKAIGAMIYPIIVLAIAIIGVIGLVIFILPQFEEMFSRFGNNSTSPLNSIKTLGFVLGALTVLSIGSFVIYRFSKKEGGKFAKKVDQILLKIPLLGRFYILQELLGLSFAMNVLTRGGVPIEEGLQETIGVMNNLTMQQGVEMALLEITKGASIHEAFANQKVFPKDLVMWLGIADETGDLSSVFKNLSSYYTNQIDIWIQKFEAIINPILIVLVGVIMIFLILTFVLPLFTMMSTV